MTVSPHAHSHAEVIVFASTCHHGMSSNMLGENGIRMATHCLEIVGKGAQKDHPWKIFSTIDGCLKVLLQCKIYTNTLFIAAVHSWMHFHSNNSL